MISSEPSAEARRVVLAPDVLAQSMLDAESAEILRLWRDDRIRPVVNRTLVIRYLVVLRRLGLAEPLLRRWGWWLTHPKRVLFNDAPAPPPRESIPELCAFLAGCHAPCCVVHGRHVSPPKSGLTGAVTWISEAELLSDFRGKDPAGKE